MCPEHLGPLILKWEKDRSQCCSLNELSMRKRHRAVEYYEIDGKSIDDIIRDTEGKGGKTLETQLWENEG